MHNNVTRNIFKIRTVYQEEFIKTFGFYLDELDKLYRLFSDIGLNKSEMKGLAENDQNIVKTYLFFLESSLTTLIGVLQLLSSNIYSDAYSLLRILYEVACLLHYANKSEDRKFELYIKFFKSGLSDREHSKGEWQLIKKAEKEYETEKPDLIPIRQLLNNYGSHISQAKIVLGNVTYIGVGSASQFFTSNFRNNRYLAVLDMLYSILLMILEEMAKMYRVYKDISLLQQEINNLPNKLLQTIRPKLQNLIEK